MFATFVQFGINSLRSIQLYVLKFYVILHKNTKQKTSRINGSKIFKTKIKYCHEYIPTHRLVHM